MQVKVLYVVILGDISRQNTIHIWSLRDVLVIWMEEKMRGYLALFPFLCSRSKHPIKSIESIWNGRYILFVGGSLES